MARSHNLVIPAPREAERQENHEIEASLGNMVRHYLQINKQIQKDFMRLEWRETWMPMRRAQKYISFSHLYGMSPACLAHGDQFMDASLPVHVTLVNSSY
jgi:hypothetical protein